MPMLCYLISSCSFSFEDDTSNLEVRVLKSIVVKVPIFHRIHCTLPHRENQTFRS